MCRSIRTLHNLAPPATDDEIAAAARQFVRKLSGSRTPSRANAVAFEQAVADVTAAARTLLDALVSPAPPRDRAVEAAKARAVAARRFGEAGGASGTRPGTEPPTPPAAPPAAR